MSANPFAAMGDLIDGGGAGLVPGAGNEVLCTVCDTVIDATTGEPLEPVTMETVEAVRQYLNEAGQNEEGGVALSTPSTI